MPFSQLHYRQPDCSSVKRSLRYIGCALVLTAGMAGFTDQACAHTVNVFINGIKSGQLHFEPPSAASFSLANAHLPEEIKSGNFTKFIFRTDIILAIEAAAKALLYSHNSPSQRRYQPPPSNMFFEGADQENRRQILFYEGLFEYSDSASERLTIYMSYLQADAEKMTEPSFDTTQQPLLATIAYTVATGTSWLDYHLKIRYIEILTPPKLAKPALTPPGPETPASQTPIFKSILVGAGIGTLASAVAYPYALHHPHSPFIPIITIVGSSYCGLAWGDLNRPKAIRRPPSSINWILAKRGRFTTQPSLSQQPDTSFSESAPITDEDTTVTVGPTDLRQRHPLK
ncbi:hypothetical protein M3P05_09450 [Sansalvadorimonas sp. 2012CJ34-2]|uniref:Uncharacterized protein n=1 Tax=Parendozoicomonas callyspongiae TaxID=2942213 RepID=A0ABT0PHD2_9GAMM|nr:hypothetical protein [Sansalvadorimonas sp. 2012CJ34-2]MCL6270157.1 hypothetical protein [Sansalvadorimonas sp. 2012CJ34-2]